MQLVVECPIFTVSCLKDSFITIDSHSICYYYSPCVTFLFHLLMIFSLCCCIPAYSWYWTALHILMCHYKATYSLHMSQSWHLAKHCIHACGACGHVWVFKQDSSDIRRCLFKDWLNWNIAPLISWLISGYLLCKIVNVSPLQQLMSCYYDRFTYLHA